MTRRRALTPGQESAVTAACRAGSMTQAEAARTYGVGSGVITSTLHRNGAILAPDADWLAPGHAAEVSGVSLGYLSELARAGRIGYVRGTARGRRLYSRRDMVALGARREGGTP